VIFEKWLAISSAAFYLTLGNPPGDGAEFVAFGIGHHVPLGSAGLVKVLKLSSAEFD
jgi:hypothetical protein